MPAGLLLCFSGGLSLCSYAMCNMQGHVVVFKDIQPNGNPVVLILVVSFHAATTTLAWTGIDEIQVMFVRAATKCCNRKNGGEYVGTFGNLAAEKCSYTRSLLHYITLGYTSTTGRSLLRHGSVDMAF